MKILMVLSDNTFPPDLRVKKEASALISAGHKIHLICRNRGDQKRKEVISGVAVHRINLPQQFFIIDHLFFLISVFFKVLKVARNEHIQAIHAHDLPLALPSLIAGRILGHRVILDLHENYPAMIKYSGAKGYDSLMTKAIVRILKRLEIFVCKKADCIIVVIDEAKARVTKLGILPNKIAIVSNYADTNRLGNIEVSDKNISSPAVIYSGGLSHHRGLDTLIDAMTIVLTRHPDVRLYLVGGNEEELRRSQLRQKIEKTKMTNNVILTGWLSFEDSINYVRGCEICVIPHLRTPHTDSTIPHKLFQFMFLKKPTLASDVKPLKRIIKITNSGLTFKAGNVEDLANNLLWMLENQDSLRAMGERGHKAIVEKYNWEMDSRNLIKLYEIMEKGE